jgi:Kef-type K+ transport system membrane component KefB
MVLSSLLLLPLLVHVAAADDDATVPFNSWGNLVDTLQYALAFIVVLVAAHPLGLFFPKLFKLPLITGYLVIGIIAGPFVANLLPKALVNMLSNYVSALALSFISFQAGQEIYLPELRPQLKQIFVLLGVLYVTAMVTLTVVHLLANNAFFYDDFITNCQLGIALMFGSISVLGSPATVMAIKIELNSVGPFTNLMLGATMTAEFVVLVSFSISRIVCSIYCADLEVTVGNLVFTLAIVASNLLLGALIGLVIILIFSIPGSAADEHLDLHDPQSFTESYSKGGLESPVDPDTMPHPHNAYVESVDGGRRKSKRPSLWTTRMSLYVKGFLWLTMGYVFYISTTTISEATVASYGLSWEVKFEPLLVLMVASCLAGHYSLIRHDMHVILDTVAPYMFLPFFVMTGAALKLDQVVDAIPLMSLYVCLRFVAIFIACYLGGRFLLKLTPRQYNNLWLTMTPQAGVALGLANEVKALSSDSWADEFAATIVAAVVVNQIIGPVLCAIGLSRAGESMYDRVAEAQPVDDNADVSDSESSAQGGRSLYRTRSRLSSSNVTQGNGDPRALLPFYKVQSAVVIGEDEVAFEVALELSLYGARVNVPLLDKELADKWHTINETILSRSAKGELIQYKNKVQEREHDEHVQGMSSADVLIFTGDGARTLEHVRTMKALLGEEHPRMIAVIPDCSLSKDLKELGVLIIQPSIALANIATRMALLDHKLAEALSQEISTTNDFATAAYFMDRDSVHSLSEMRLDGRRLALGRSVVNHHSVNYDRLAEALAAENLPMPPPPSRVSMFGTSAAGFDPFARRGDGMSAYEHFVVQDEPDAGDEPVFNQQFVQRSPRLGVFPSPQGSNPYSFVRSRSSRNSGGGRPRLNSGTGSVQRGLTRTYSDVM